MPISPTTNGRDADLARFFTDVDPLRTLFSEMVAAPALNKRLLVIHGVGGVGKSSLLRMFRLHCKSVHVPVALASGDEAKSAVDVLARWAEDLKADGIIASKFAKTYEYYRLIQAKASEQAKKAQERMVAIATKTASETAKAAGGALVGAAVGSAIPGVGTVIGAAFGGALGGMSAEALTDWLVSRGFKRPDIDLLLDPAKRLTEDFVSDLQGAAARQRIVLMLDTFEQMTTLQDWAREVVQALPANVLCVIAGRALPEWSRAWPGWMLNAQVEELKPMAEDAMRDLVRRYYATMRGGEPAPAQVEAIIRFARGLPMVVTSAVQLWVKYGVEDFQSVKPEIVANLVDRLMEGVPAELVPALEAAAIVRWFDQSILRAVTGNADVRQMYDELRRFPFVRSRTEGLALHDAVREMIDEDLRMQDPERHRELHERAAVYFEKRLDTATVAESERLVLEHMYHRVLADEKQGIKLFQQTAGELVRLRLVTRLQALLNDADTYSLLLEGSKLWRMYYGAQLGDFRRRYDETEKVYEAISQSSAAERQLRAYALCDWGAILQRGERLREPGGTEKAIEILESSLRLAPQLDSKLIFAYTHLRGVYLQQGNSEKAIDCLQTQLAYLQRTGDLIGVAETLAWIRGTYALLGDWRQAVNVTRQAIEISEGVSERAFVQSRLVQEAPWFPIFCGRYREPEEQLLSALAYSEQGGDTRHQANILLYLGYVLAMQGKFEAAASRFTESQIAQKSIGRWLGVWEGFLGASLISQGDLQTAEQHILQSVALKAEMNDKLGLPELFNWLAMIHEIRASEAKPGLGTTELEAAASDYRQCLSYSWTNRRNWQASALTGLLRVKHKQGDYAAIPPLLVEAEQLAQQYEYNDHLASLRLTQGHVAWEGCLSEWGIGYDVALHYYQLALIHALRYNRFLLDELLSGRSRGTPLQPIIPHCLARGEEGRRMLIALRDWWQRDFNDIGAPRPDTISPIPEGIALTEAERIARDREPGDGSQQKNVVEQIEMALH